MCLIHKIGVCHDDIILNIISMEVLVFDLLNEFNTVKTTAIKCNELPYLVCRSKKCKYIFVKLAALLCNVQWIRHIPNHQIFSCAGDLILGHFARAKPNMVAERHKWFGKDELAPGINRNIIHPAKGSGYGLIIIDTNNYIVT